MAEKENNNEKEFKEEKNEISEKVEKKQTEKEVLKQKQEELDDITDRYKRIFSKLAYQRKREK